MDETKKQSEEVGSGARENTKPDSSESKVELKPAMPELGSTPCPVCKRRVTVFVTKTKRPFINCGLCGARIFYNGSGAIRRLQRQLKKPKGSSLLPGPG